MQVILALVLLLAQAERVRVCDKTDVSKCASVNSSGQVAISGSISASTTGKATAAAPTYVEGTDNPLSLDLTGNIRTLATATTAASATTANPSYVEGSTSALSQDLSGHLRVGATQAGSWTNACTQSGTWTVQPGNTANTTAWKVDGSAVTQPVSGTFWQATQPVSGPLTDTQLRASAVPTTDAHTTAAVPLSLRLSDGAAFYKATTPSDTQPVSGTFWQATQPVSGTVAATQSGTWTVQPGNTANTTPWLFDLNKVAGTATVTGGLAGTLAVGGTQANNAAITANPVLDGIEALSTQPAAATTGNARRIVGSLDGAVYVRPNGPITWTCIVSAQTVKKTCQAAPGASLKLYVTDVWWTNNSAVATSAALASGTGADCVTTTTNKTAAHTVPVSGAGSNVWLGGMTTPIAMAANEALCTVPGGANSYSATISGYTAP